MSRLAWVLLGPFALLVVIRGVGIVSSDVDGSLLAAVACLGVLVGLSEELLFRGVFLRCMRNGQMSEGGNPGPCRGVDPPEAHTGERLEPVRAR